MKRSSLLLFPVITALSFFPLCAQDETDPDDTRDKVEAMDETLSEIKSVVDALRKLKFSGYIHAQYQIADTMGNSLYPIGNFSSGSFGSGVDNRFTIRRGRLKAIYTDELSSFVFQIDASEKGVIVRDVYATITEPWLRNFTLTAGIFDRPFGFEITYSSSLRESPERSRLFQSLFPGERELGAQLGIAFPEDEGILGHFNFKGGIFNGVRTDGTENDSNKDFIGRLGFELPFADAGLAIDGGMSLYSGRVNSRSAVAYTMGSTGGVETFVRDSSAANLNKDFDRTYMGGDLEVYYDLPVLGGFSLRGEYIGGRQPSTAKSNLYYNPSGADSVFVRNVHGFYVNYVQNIGLYNQLVVKYDVFDPNTEVQGSEIGRPGSLLTPADVRYSTFGLGWIYYWNSHVKLTAYYEIVKNEEVNAAATGSLAAYRDDVPDNIFTFRIQYKY